MTPNLLGQPLDLVVLEEVDDALGAGWSRQDDVYGEGGAFGQFGEAA
jgi:hypothetical protein